MSDITARSIHLVRYKNNYCLEDWNIKAEFPILGSPCLEEATVIGLTQNTNIINCNLVVPTVTL